ncbi:MAG: dihydrolipoyl dehydrogenase [Chloroflexi bacterium]|nr:dihydrolipoyl dehydrogenase [Chloroflexota bacterium]
MKEADVLIIGAGPGGYVCAIRASQLGARVILVEKDALGGTCINRGCIPTKVLIRAVDIIDTARHKSKDYGINIGELNIDFTKMMGQKEQIVSSLVSGIQALMKSNSIEVVKGDATVLSPNQVEVSNGQGEKEIVQCRRMILATGSVAATPPVPGINGEKVITSDGALALSEIPKSMIVIGGGAIGVEFATIFAGLGTKVSLLEMMPQLIPTEDAELAAALRNSLRKKGIEVLTGARVSQIEDDLAGGKTVTVTTGDGEKKLTGDIVLSAAGRKPNTEGLGLEMAGIATEKARILVNRKMETNVPGVYGIGDAAGRIQLAHVASAEGEVAAANAARKEAVMDYRVVPRCIYGLPEAAAVGMTEKEAREKVGDVAVGSFPFIANGKAIIRGERNGFVKFVTESKTGQVLGVHIFGAHATDIISEAALSIKMGATVEDIFSTIHPHPTLSEMLREAALDAKGRVLHNMPQVKGG